MITISTADLRTFFKRTRAIKQNDILPILEYIKIEYTPTEITLTDTNEQTYAIHKMTGSAEGSGAFLVNRRILSSVIDTTKSESITIRVEDGKKKDTKQVIIKDDSGPVSSPTDKIDLYSKIPEITKQDKIFLSGEVLNAIEIASNYAKKDTKSLGIDPLEVVYLKNKGDYCQVAATNLFIVYMKKIANADMDIMLYPENISFLNLFSEANYFQSDNYNFFECGETTYGFIKPVYTMPDFSVILRDLNDDQIVKIKKELIIDFCERAIKINKSGYPHCMMGDMGDNKVLFTLEDTDYETACNMVFDCEKNFDIKDFFFNAELMLGLIKPLPYDLLYFHAAPDKFYITSPDDPDYTGCIMGIGTAK